MDRISDSGSDGWGSIPHGGTNYKNNALIFRALFFIAEPDTGLQAPKVSLSLP